MVLGTILFLIYSNISSILRNMSTENMLTLSFSIYVKNLISFLNAKGEVIKMQTTRPRACVRQRTGIRLEDTGYSAEIELGSDQNVPCNKQTGQ